MSGEQEKRRRVGIVGFGSLGKFLYDKITTDAKAMRVLEIAFVWNRTSSKPREEGVPADLILEDLNDFASKGADIIVEVAHPQITEKYAELFLKHADYYVGSPTAFADMEIEQRVRQAAATSNFGVYVPSGALWAAEDIKKMADGGSLKGLIITMKKHPQSLKLTGELAEKLKDTKPGVENVLYEGPVRALCPLAPNNVNTMACAALAGHNLGFDRVVARLVADDRLNSHNIDIEVHGPETPGYGSFVVKTERINPAPPGAVTGQQTYLSFLSSLLRAHGRGTGFHFC